MIGATFTLFFLMIFMLSVLVMDSILFLKAELEAFERNFGSDNKVFPDHEY